MGDEGEVEEVMRMSVSIGRNDYRRGGGGGEEVVNLIMWRSSVNEGLRIRKKGEARR